VLDSQLDQKIDSAAGASCIHCGEEAQVIPWTCVHRMLYCSAVQSSVDGSALDFGLLNWENT
jgi:hypothetical protein